MLRRRLLLVRSVHALKSITYLDGSAWSVNRDLGVRIDHQLKGCGLSYARFINPHPLGRLTWSQSREFKKVICPLSGEERFRSVIRDKSTGLGRFEVPVKIVDGVGINHTHTTDAPIWVL